MGPDGNSFHDHHWEDQLCGFKLYLKTPKAHLKFQQLKINYLLILWE